MFFSNKLTQKIIPIVFKYRMREKHETSNIKIGSTTGNFNPAGSKPVKIKFRFFLNKP